MEPKRSTKEPSQKDKDEAEKLSKESEQWWCKNKTKALDCIERAIQLVPNNEEYWNQKGCFLRCLGRSEDAIESYNTSISIKPTSYVYLEKAYALCILNRLEEEFNCLEEGIRQFPDDRQLISLLKASKSKLKR